MDQHRDAASSLLILPQAVRGAEHDAAEPWRDCHGLRLRLVLREGGRPWRSRMWFGTDGPRQPPAVTLQKVLPVVTDN